MAIYINPGNQAFEQIAGANYVDKTGLISLINQSIGGPEKLFCVSRPRRFGKSYAAKMLAAYYDCSCQSHHLFDDKKIAGSKDYHTYLNHFNVIWLDISAFISEVKSMNGSLREVPAMIRAAIQKDLIHLGCNPGTDDNVNDMMIRFTEGPEGKPFIFIIDEWDAMIREAKDDMKAQEAYLNLLRGWFKSNNFTPKAVAAAYITGILPIKKDGSESAISDFLEYSILDPGVFAEFTGFTESEVRQKCLDHHMDFSTLKSWYDGYDFPEVGAIYNPYSVINAIRTGKCRSYWRRTSASESLRTYISLNFDDLQVKIARLIAGENIPVNVESFQNDLESFESSDDVLTLLIHLGYLTYHESDSTVCIPNEEIRLEFEQLTKTKNTNVVWVQLIERSNQLLSDTISGNVRAVESAIEAIRQEQYAPQFYNNEQALRAIIKYAYLAAFGKYLRVEEFPSGKGLADVVFIPLQASPYPAMVIELKWNKTADGAIKQIKDRQYISSLKPFSGNILLVGINYDPKTGRHSCIIEHDR